MNDDLVSKAIDAYENEPGVMQFPAMYAAGKVFESFYKAEIELLRTEVKGLSQSLTDCLECEKDYLSEISELRAENEALLEVITPFAHFALVMAACGGTSPKSGTVYSVCTSSGEAEITVEDFEAAFNSIARSACTEIDAAMKEQAE